MRKEEMKDEQKMSTDKITRVEIIDWRKDVLDEARRAHGIWDENISVELSFQDANRTLKVFITDRNKLRQTENE